MAPDCTTQLGARPCSAGGRDLQVIALPRSRTVYDIGTAQIGLRQPVNARNCDTFRHYATHVPELLGQLLSIAASEAEHTNRGSLRCT